MQSVRKNEMMNATNHNCKSCAQKLDLLRALDFAIQETVLYLDAYPDSLPALRYYHELLHQREEAVMAYEGSCGPLTIYGNRSTDSWDWTLGPWPWEADAN